MQRLTIINVAFPFARVSADPVGGAEQVLASLDRALVAAGHRSIVIAAEGSRVAGDLIAIPAPAQEIGRREWIEAHDFLRRRIPDVARQSEANLIHMHGVDFASYLPPPAASVLATLHMPAGTYDENAIRPARDRTWLNCVSEAQYQSLDPNPNVVAVIENGVPTSFSTPRPRRRSFALAMGRICPEKGFDLALDAAKRAGVPFLLAGQVYPYAEHEAYFRDEIAPRLDRCRRWIGRVEGEHKWRLLQSARCLLAPSRVAETASLVAREALAAGTPVIAFPNGALAQTVEPGVTGYLVEDVAGMADAIARCRDIDPDACRAVARSRFSLDRMQNEYLDLYGRLAEAV